MFYTYFLLTVTIYEKNQSLEPACCIGLANVSEPLLNVNAKKGTETANFFGRINKRMKCLQKKGMSLDSIKIHYTAQNLCCSHIL